MSLLATRRSRLAASASAATLVVGATLAVTATPAFAADMTITSVAPAKVAAGSANRVVIITGTNFDEDAISDISLGTDTDCQDLSTYVVTSATQISVKTPGVGTTGSAPGCAASANGTAESVTIDPSATGAADVVKTGAITFVTPPSLDAVADKPVITDNSSQLATADQIQTLNAAGGQLLRITAGSDFAFDGRASAGLTGTYGGKPLTSVGFIAADGTAQAATAAPTANGNVWLARTATGLTASTDPTLSITQGTVSKNFLNAATGTTIVSTPTVTSLDVNSGKVNAATTVKVTGTNFSTTLGDMAVSFCGVSGTVTASTATVVTVTTPTTVSGTAGTGIGTATAGVCPVVVSKTQNGVTTSSPVTPTSFFAFVDR
ncbi:IPT/TIG domain-containing protein [Actinoplanes sp. RD1]|uniref:IPT/TIG domain-containing protein n=1 Tax=Actinoplanes sp. RD1 TaxID=3064538 RepID=UPI0027425B39|nr:IPT/TIG domain-containing protein [Actinoplanes sp. RD1]